jgi:DNA-binding CsgD family transcriptional regulator
MVTVQGWLRRLERLCASSNDARQLRAEVLLELGRVVSFDAYVWLLTDPVTAVGVSPLADVPSFSELPTTIRLKYQAEVNRWTDLARAGQAVGLLSRRPQEPGGSSAWRSFLARYDIADVASVVFADRFGIWGFLDLWRSGEQPFSDIDATYLSAAAQALTVSLRSRQAATFEVPTDPHGRELGPAAVVLDGHLVVQNQTAAGEAWLAMLLRPAPGGGTVPASVYNVAAQLLAVEQGVDANPAMARGHLADGLWITLRAARLGATEAGAVGDRPIVVTIEEASAPERSDVFGRAFGLSQRERELLGRLTTGEDTRTLARQLDLSAYTVQDHLKSIFAKTGAASRQLLLARATGR